MILNFEKFKNTIKEPLSKFFQEVGKITQTVTENNILTYIGWVFSSFNCVPIS
jgi:hypothetical protein